LNEERLPAKDLELVYTNKLFPIGVIANGIVWANKPLLTKVTKRIKRYFDMFVSFLLFSALEN